MFSSVCSCLVLYFKRCCVRPGLFPLEYSHFFDHRGLEDSSFMTVFVKLTLPRLRPSTSPHLPPPSTAGCNHLLGTWISRRPAAHSTLLPTKTDSSQRPRYSFFSLVQKNTHSHPHVAPHILHSYILSSTEQWFWQNPPLGSGDAIRLFGWVSITFSPSTLMHSKLMTRSLNMSLFTAPQLLHLYTSRRRKKINVHRKLKEGVSQVCPQVRGALWDIDESPLLQKPCWDNTSTRILLTEVVQTVHLGKVGQYFIIRWDEICLQSRYKKTNWSGS